MDLKTLTDRAVLRITDAERATRDGRSDVAMIKRIITRRARDIAEKPDTEEFPVNGLTASKVAEWIDDTGAVHQVLYFPLMNHIQSVKLTPNRPSGRKQSTHELDSLPAEHLYQHFKPLMD